MARPTTWVLATTPEIYPGTESVEFSPTTDFQTTMDVVGKSMEAMGS
jgi:hypothetical protein